MGVVADDRTRDLVARARAIREAAGISLAKMAAECGASKPTLSRWERDPPAGLGRLPRDRPKVRRWLAVLHLLDVTSRNGTAPAAQARNAAGADA